MNTEKYLKDHHELIVSVAAKHGARNVRVFGSFVRGEARDDSDLDLLVDVGAEHSPFFPGGLVAELEELLDRRVDVVTEDGLHWYIKEQVLNEAMPL